MDTNLVTAIVTALIAKQGSGGQSSSFIITVIAAFVIQIITNIASFLQAKSAALSAVEAKVKAMEAAEQARKMALETNVSVQAIHTAVNSERTAMMLELKEAREEIRLMSSGKAADDERERERERVRAIPPAPAAGLTEAQIAQIVAALKAAV